MATRLVDAPADRLTAGEFKLLWDRFPDQRELLGDLELLSGTVLADTVHRILAGHPNESDNRPGYKIHGVGLMERTAYRQWNRQQLVSRILAMAPFEVPLLQSCRPV